MASLFMDLPRSALVAVVHHHRWPFHLNLSVQPIIALAAGIIILIFPRLLNLIVAIYLIVVGLIGVFGLPW